MSQQCTLTHMTLASEKTAAIADFYNNVLGASFEPFEAYGSTLYSGQLGGVSAVICPNDIAGVDATRARHQLKFDIADVDEAVRLAQNAGGTIHTAPYDSDGRRAAVLCDPDNNLIEIEADV